MNRDSGLDPILGPWMRRSAPTAPHDLLGRVMTEVETMSQRQAAGMTWFTASPAHIGLTATALVAAAALAVGILIGNNGRIGPGPTESASPTPAVTRTTDRVGDGPAAYDIVAVTTSVADGGILRVAVELAAPWPDDGRLSAWFVPNEASHSGGGGGFGRQSSCDSMGSGYAAGVASGSGSFSSHYHDASGDGITTQRESLDARVEGTVMTFEVPLAYLRDPETLGIGLGAGTAETGMDFFPDGRGGDCQPVPLASAWPTPNLTRFTDPSGDGSEAYDITAVTTSVVDDDILRIGVELATRWPDEGILRMWFVPNDASHTSGGLGAHNRCDPYGAGYSLFVTSGSGTFTSHTHDSRGDQVTTQEETLDVTVEGNVMTVDLPLRFLRDPKTLGVALDAGTVEAGFDAWPDRPDSAEDGCQPVPLPDTYQ